MKRNYSLIFLLVCGIGFIFGIAELFKLRFESGDVYPAYSSLRLDPLGTSAFYESLSAMPGLEVQRDFRMTDELPEGRNVAYLHLAGDQEQWDEIPESSYNEIDTFLRHGGRLVVALFPETSKTFNNISRQQKTISTGSPKKKAMLKPKPGKKKKDTNEDKFFKTVSLPNKWGFGFEFKELKHGLDGVYEPARVENNDEPSLPAAVYWHSAVVMTNLDKAWRVIYDRDGEAVLAERQFGAGSVVFSTDSYFLSNEAMSKDRHAELLAWVVGPCRKVFFDEAHLGITDNPGVATLMRNYRLHGLMVGLFLLAGLYIWKNSVSFAPPLEAEYAANAVEGKDSAAGFVNLLRRHIKTGEVLGICIAEWKKSLVKSKLVTARVQRVEAVALSGNNPIETYRAICHTLKEPAVTAISRQQVAGTTQQGTQPAP